MSFRPEIKTEDGVWRSNGVRTLTEQECNHYIAWYAMRGLTILDRRVIECSGAVNAVFRGRLIWMDEIGRKEVKMLGWPRRRWVF